MTDESKPVSGETAEQFLATWKQQNLKKPQTILRLSSPQVVEVMEAYATSIRAERDALKEALRLKDRTVFLDFQTDPTENVWPMVQAGKGITEMLLGSEDL